MATLKNYGTNEYPVIALDPAASADTSTTTPYLRYEQALANLAIQVKALQGLISGGTVGSFPHFGTGVTGTSGDISYTVEGSKKGDTYYNTSTGNYYVAKAADVWNFLGNLKGPQGDPGQDGEDGTDGTNGTNGTNGTDGVGSGWDVSTDTASTSCSYALTHGKYKYFSNSAISSLTITSSLANVGDICRVEFTSPSTATTYTKPTGCRHFGDDCDSSADFTPAANTPYSLTYELCGNGLKCYVKSL